MVVEVEYRSPSTKEFRIESASGSKLIMDRVFKKLFEGEQEALRADMQRQTALNRDNYEFTLIAFESTSDGSRYVLDVKPRRKDKFLYRGRIWVDAADFAVVRIQATPAKNPSFWTKNSRIEHEYGKTGEFWLPVRNHSVTSIRLGGRAEMIIEYLDYQITGAAAVREILKTQKAAAAADTGPQNP